MRSKYNNASGIKTIEGLSSWAIQITREREFDLQDYETQVAVNPRIYPTPTSSSDMIGTEKVGDIAIDTDYIYTVVDNAGTLEWRRVGVSAF